MRIRKLDSASVLFVILMVASLALLALHILSPRDEYASRVEWPSSSSSEPKPASP